MIAIVPAVIVSIIYGESGTATARIQPGDFSSSCRSGIPVVMFTPTSSRWASRQSDLAKVLPICWASVIAGQHLAVCSLQRRDGLCTSFWSARKLEYDAVILDHVRKLARFGSGRLSCSSMSPTDGPRATSMSSPPRVRRDKIDRESIEAIAASRAEGFKVGRFSPRRSREEIAARASASNATSSRWRPWSPRARRCSRGSVANERVISRCCGCSWSARIPQLPTRTCQTAMARPASRFTSASREEKPLTGPVEDISSIYAIEKDPSRGDERIAQRLALARHPSGLVGASPIRACPLSAIHGVKLTETGRLAALRTLAPPRDRSNLARALGYQWDRVHEEAERWSMPSTSWWTNGAMIEAGVDPHGAPIPPARRVDETEYTHWRAGQERPASSFASPMSPEMLRYLGELHRPGTRLTSGHEHVRRTINATVGRRNSRSSGRASASHRARAGKRTKRR